MLCGYETVFMLGSVAMAQLGLVGVRWGSKQAKNSSKRGQSDPI